MWTSTRSDSGDGQGMRESDKGVERVMELLRERRGDGFEMDKADVFVVESDGGGSLTQPKTA